MNLLFCPNDKHFCSWRKILLFVFCSYDGMCTYDRIVGGSIDEYFIMWFNTRLNEQRKTKKEMFVGEFMF